MSQKLEIPVSATLNTKGVEDGAKRIDKELDRVGKKKIDPVQPDALSKIDQLFQALQKLDRELARRLRVTGQDKLGPDAVNWDAVYTNSKFRRAKLQQMQSFFHQGGVEFTPPGVGGGGGGWRNGAKGMAVNTAQAGMRAAGPVGNVAANALGAGMSGGFGAGMAGLLGGIAALGVGKLVGAIAEKVDQAENNNIAYDRLKRTLGDVNVSFNGLKAAIKGASEGLNVTYDEGARLATMFAKEGNVRGGYGEIPGELGLGVGLSRGFGLEPEKGVGLLAQMRGVGVTKDTQESRRVALLIGETIAKSDAFAKADEVMDALANFATAQTRQSLVAANLQGYAGMFSSMVGSGIAGLDPAGSASILGRMNAALSAGGANGEASQFFTSMVGNRMGLDPLQMQVLREGGMFATKDQMFGVGSAYTRYMGQTGPTGGQTYYDSTRQLIEQKYSGDDERSKLLRANAFANHTGLNMNQAMAMLSLQPNQMGELQKYAGDMTKLSASGIGNMSKALFGSNDDRSALAQSLLGRDDVSQADKDRLRGAMASGNTEQQKEVLAKLSAQYEQERTTGSDIRDSRAALDNIKTNIADKMVPYLLDMKKALIYMAGENGQKTPDQVMKEISEGESKDRVNRMKGERDTKLAELDAEDEKLKNEQQGLNTMMTSGLISKEEYGKQWGAAQQRRDQIKQERDAAQQRYDTGVAAEKDGRIAPTGANIGDPGSINKSMKFFMDKGWTREQAAGITANLMKESGMRPGAVGDGGKAYGIAQWHPDRQRDFERWAGKSIRDATVQEQMEFVHYEMTQGKEKSAGDKLKGATSARESGAIVSKYYERPKATEPEMAERGSMAEGISRTPLPEAKPDSSAGPGRGSAVSFAPLDVTVRHVDTWGREVRPAENLQTRVNAPNPNTYRDN